MRRREHEVTGVAAKGAALLVLVLAAFAPAAAAAQLRGVASQRLAAIVNPEGAEHLATIGVRAPFGDQAELLLDGAHVEAGIQSGISPVDARTSGYLQWSPLAILVLRAEVGAIQMWSLGMPGAAYHSVGGYGAELAQGTLAPERGADASGWNLTVSATLQGAVPVGRGRLILWSQATFAHDSLGEATHYYTPRYDMILARQDWVIGHHTMFLFEHPLDVSGVSLRLGSYDHLAYAPRPDTLINQLGAVAAVVITDPTEGVDEVMPFARVGLFTDHERRAGTPTFLFGVTVAYSFAD